jgi:hypothetical protein
MSIATVEEMLFHLRCALLWCTPHSFWFLLKRCNTVPDLDAMLLQVLLLLLLMCSNSIVFALLILLLLLLLLPLLLLLQTGDICDQHKETKDANIAKYR